jgi:predicted phage terminase large subunit-like protein
MINAAPDILLRMPESDRQKVLELLSELNKRKTRAGAQEHFQSFVNYMWPEFVHGAHHDRIAALFDRIAAGELKRVIINLPPRHTKSEYGSHLLPAWFLGRRPEAQIMQISHTAELAENFGRKVRNTVDSNTYRDIFPDTNLRKDSTAAARWNTNANGTYLALGVGGAVAGRGADLLILDDVHSEQEGKSADPKVFDATYDYYMTGPRQRLQPHAAILVLMTRWGKRDLTGRLIEEMLKNPDGDQWEVFTFPAIMPSGNPLWPEYWSIEELLRTKLAIDNRFWQSQYMQDPISDASAIVKREWWQVWEKDDPPGNMYYTLMAWDTAYEKHNQADYSAVTVWGVFDREMTDGTWQPNIILLNAVKKRVEFPELKEWVRESYDEWQPDTMIVEKRASGASLIQELRTMGIPVSEVTSARGAKNQSNDKMARLNSVADVFRSGFVWAPETHWADMVKDEVAEFPAGMNDDLTDTCSMAINYFRKGGFVRTLLDELEEEKYFRKKVAYY